MAKKSTATSPKPKAEKKAAASKAPEKKTAPKAAKRKATKAAAAEEKPVSAGPKLSSHQFKCPGEQEVVNLVRRLKAQAKVAQETSGVMGEMVAKAVETKHFDRKALSIVRSLESMSDNKLQVTLPHLMMYIDALKLNDRAQAQGQLIPDRTAANDDDGDGDSQMDLEEAIDSTDGPSLQGDDVDQEAMAMH